MSEEKRALEDVREILKNAGWEPPAKAASSGLVVNSAGPRLHPPTRRGIPLVELMLVIGVLAGVAAIGTAFFFDSSRVPRDTTDLVARIDSLEKAAEENRLAVKNALLVTERLKAVRSDLTALREALADVSDGLELARKEIQKTRTEVTQLVKKDLDEREATIRQAYTKTLGEAAARMEGMIRKEAAERAKEITELRKFVGKGQVELPDRKGPEGTWKLVAVKGPKNRDVPKEDVEKAGLTLHLKDSKAVFESRESKASGVYQAGDSKTEVLEMSFAAPEKIPFLPLRDSRIEARYKVEGTKLQILVSGLRRPVTFDLEKHPDATLLTFERIP